MVDLHWYSYVGGNTWQQSQNLTIVYSDTLTPSLNGWTVGTQGRIIMIDATLQMRNTCLDEVEVGGGKHVFIEEKTSDHSE